MIKVTPYRPEHKEAILDLMGSRQFKRKIWSWQFTDNPWVDAFQPVLVTDEWGTIIGFNGEMPVKIKYNDTVIDGLWSCDFFVDKRFRGKKVGRLIKENLHRHSPVVMASGISDVASGVLLHMGWKQTRDAENFRKISSVNSIKSLLLTCVQLINRIRGLAIRERNIYEITTVLELPDQDKVDSLWNTVAPEYGKIVVRNYDYLNWKYCNHPLADYSFICAELHGELSAILITRITRRYVYVVDYLGPRYDRGLKSSLLEQCMSAAGQMGYFNCMTSDREWKDVLLAHGFHRQLIQQRFYMYSKLEQEQDLVKDWFIMGGDSDGDLLMAARDGPFKPSVTAGAGIKIEVKQLDEEFFRQGQEIWEKLVANSDADPLFLDWTWQYSWWKQWSVKNGLKLYLLGAFSDDGELLGIAPMYKVVCSPRRHYSYIQVQLIGSSWGAHETVRTEYLDFITRRDIADAVRKSLLTYLDEDNSWNQMIFADMNVRSPTFEMLLYGRFFTWDYHRVVQEDKGTYVDTAGRFEDFLSNLGKHTRLKLYNRRSYLQSFGEIHIELADASSIDEYFRQLNEMHNVRWGKDCFIGGSLEFHKSIAQWFFDRGALYFSRLKVADKTVSLLYNLRLGHCEYNIQSGFNDNFDKKLSLGTLHLGYAIEQAFNDKNVTRFDLLAGIGKNTFYKSHFGSRKYEFRTIQINRKPFLKLIYQRYDRLPVYLKNILSKYLLSRE